MSDSPLVRVIKKVDLQSVDLGSILALLAQLVVGPPTVRKTIGDVDQSRPSAIQRLVDMTGLYPQF